MGREKAVCPITHNSTLSSTMWQIIWKPKEADTTWHGLWRVLHYYCLPRESPSTSVGCLPVRIGILWMTNLFLTSVLKMPCVWKWGCFECVFHRWRCRRMGRQVDGKSAISIFRMDTAKWNPEPKRNRENSVCVLNELGLHRKSASLLKK